MNRPAQAFVAAVISLAAAARGDEPRFERVVVDNAFPGVYQVELADVNRDGKLDVVAVGGGTCAWYENPRWTKRIVTTPRQTPSIISSATADLDGDGRAEIAIGYDFDMNDPKRGKLVLASQAEDLDQPWRLEPIADVPSVHRLRWTTPKKGGRTSTLVVAPIFGRDATPPTFQNDPAVIQAWTRLSHDGGKPMWSRVDVGSRLVTHSIEVHPDAGGTGYPVVLSADNEGVSLFEPKSRDLHYLRRALIPGAAGTAPKRGSSEVHLGKRRDGRRFLATIDPWHGTQVAVCLEKAAGTWEFEPRVVLDDTLDDGHALCVLDIDRDGDDEIIAGHRGKDHRISLYHFDARTSASSRTVLDRGVAAQDVRGGDVDGDGAADLVAVGGSTHNVVLYLNRAARQ